MKEPMGSTTGRALGEEVVTASRHDDVREVARRMRDHRVGCVVVVDGRKPVGILTDRDLALRVVAEGLPSNTPVAAVMTPDPQTARVGAGVETLVTTMRKAGARRLPLVDDSGRLAGIVTHDDLVMRLAHAMTALGEGLQQSVDAPDLR